MREPLREAFFLPIFLLPSGEDWSATFQESVWTTCHSGWDHHAAKLTHTHTCSMNSLFLLKPTRLVLAGSFVSSFPSHKTNAKLSQVPLLSGKRPGLLAFFPLLGTEVLTVVLSFWPPLQNIRSSWYSEVGHMPLWKYQNMARGGERSVWGWRPN